ncbi:hypothetical protein KRP22_002443 [Phytophthora ramorum]|nr:hypothetical protein KRP22_6091 [Phytophthora ramorum]KAH7510143.1 hypothetical protein KRP22_1636 [Phytophthora ramorum]
MDWMQSRGQLLHGSAPAGVPSFKLVDANNRVRELTDPLKRQLGATSAFYQPQLSDDGLSAAELEEQRQLEQQLQVQKEEMCFISPLPRPNSDVPRLRVPSTSHAFTYGGSSSSNVHSTPPLAPPVSPFASMALSAPAAPVGKAHNPFLSAKVEKSPRLPSFNAIRNSPGTHLKSLGIASRPPPLSLRSFSDVSTLSSSSQSPSPSPSPLHQPQMLHQHHPKAPLRSMSNSSLTSAASTSPMLYSQSLPGVSFLQDRRRSRMSFDGSDRMSISSEDEDSGMRLLSSSVGRTEGNSDAMTAAANAAAQAALNSNALSRMELRGGRGLAWLIYSVEGEKRSRGWQLSENDLEALVSSREVVFLTTLQDDIGTLEVKLRCVSSSGPSSTSGEKASKAATEEDEAEAPTGFNINWSSSEALQKDIAEKVRLKAEADKKLIVQLKQTAIKAKKLLENRDYLLVHLHRSQAASKIQRQFRALQTRKQEIITKLRQEEEARIAAKKAHVRDKVTARNRQRALTMRARLLDHLVNNQISFSTNNARPEVHESTRIAEHVETERAKLKKRLAVLEVQRRQLTTNKRSNQIRSNQHSPQQQSDKLFDNELVRAVQELHFTRTYSNQM